MNHFKDKIVIVTGAASGIGKAICIYLAERRAKVIIADQNYEAATMVRDEIIQQGGIAEAVKVDVTKKDELEGLIQNTIAQYGKIDCMFNNAGIAMGGEFQDFDPEDFARVIDVNLMGTVNGCYYVYPVMKKQGFGQIVNIASVAGLIPGGLMTSYSASKFGQVGFSMTLRGEAKQYGIKVNTVCPGYIKTPMHQQAKNVTDYIDGEEDIKINKRMDSIFKYPTAQDCVRQMMRGIRRNRAIIISPRRHKIFWWMERLLPAISTSIWPLIIKRMKTKSEAGILQEVVTQTVS